jgi:hypothetical protein
MFFNVSHCFSIFISCLYDFTIFFLLLSSFYSFYIILSHLISCHDSEYHIIDSLFSINSCGFWYCISWMFLWTYLVDRAGWRANRRLITEMQFHSLHFTFRHFISFRFIFFHFDLPFPQGEVVWSFPPEVCTIWWAASSWSHIYLLLLTSG